MSVRLVTGDILKQAPTGRERLVCPVNTQGVMGAGLAGQFAEKHPFESTAYKTHARREGMGPGDVFESGLVWFVATKGRWEAPSREEWVITACDRMATLAHLEGLETVHLPALGCGLGKLDWRRVEQIMVERLGASKTLFRVYAPW